MAAIRPKTLEPSLGAAPWKGGIGEVAAGEELVEKLEGDEGAVPEGAGAAEEPPVGNGAAEEAGGGTTGVETIGRAEELGATEETMARAEVDCDGDEPPPTVTVGVTVT